MTQIATEQRQYPVGKYRFPESVSPEVREGWIADIEALPGQLAELSEAIAPEQEDNRYRPDGWTIRQVLHHTADSHMNAFIRFKLGLTEDLPTIKPYMQDLWAALPDSNVQDVSDSILILRGLHARWATLLRNMNDADFDRKVYHPEYDREISLLRFLGLYAWHGRHHLAHVRLALEQPA